MQLTVNEFELLSNLLLERKQEEIDGLAHKLHSLQEEHDAFKSVFKDLERSYTERGIALEAATKGIKLGQWIDVKDLHFQIGYTDGSIMGDLKFTAASGADRVRFYYGKEGALEDSSGYRVSGSDGKSSLSVGLSTGQPEGR